MTSDGAKDALEHAAAITGAAFAASATSAAVAPVVVGAAVPAAVIAAVHAWYALQAWRVKEWWDYCINGSDEPEGLQASIDKAVATNDQRRIEGILRGARAAADVIDPVVIAAIGTLSRRYLSAGATLPPWLFRAQLDLLSAMSGDEYASMQQLIQSVLLFASDHPDLTRDGRVRLCADKGESGLLFAVRHGQKHPICSVRAARRLFRLLKAHDLGEALAALPTDVAAVDSLGVELEVVTDLGITLTTNPRP